jgi:hypothetical protein
MASEVQRNREVEIEHHRTAGIGEADILKTNLAGRQRRRP